MLIDFSLLFRNRNYALLYIGQAVSFFGTMMTGVVLPWQIYHLTQSVVMIGLLSFCQLLPLLFTALIGGVLADKYPRRNMLLIAECILTFSCLLLAWNAFQPHPSVLLIFLTAMLMSSLNGLHRPALESLTQQMIAANDFTTAGALAGLKYNAGAILAPAVTGMLIAHTSIGWTFIVDFVTFLISLLALALLKPPLQTVNKEISSVWTALKDGLHYARKRPELLGSYFVDFAAMVFGMPSALFPIIAQSWGGASVLGLLYSAPAVGALLVSLTSGWTKKIHRYGAAIALAACGWGIAIMLFGLSHQLISALFFLAIAGGFDEISAIFRMTLWNTSISPAMRGRLAGIEMISYLSGPRLGDAESSLVASLCGVTFAVVSGGALCIAGVGLVCYLLPSFCKFKTVNICKE